MIESNFSWKKKKKKKRDRKKKKTKYGNYREE